MTETVPVVETLRDSAINSDASLTVASAINAMSQTVRKAYRDRVSGEYTYDKGLSFKTLEERNIWVEEVKLGLRSEFTKFVDSL